MMQQLKSYLLIIFLAGSILLPGLFSTTVIDRDEPYFVQATRQMLETGDYWQINFQAQPRHLKPPGIYWLQASLVKLFSPNSFQAIGIYRLASFLGGMLSLLALFYFTRKFYSTKIAFYAVGLLASSLLFFIEVHLAVTDAVLLFTMIVMQGALWQIYVNARSQKNSSWKLILLFWLAMSLGILIKGITPLVGFLTIFSLAIADRSWDLLRHTKIFFGIITSLLILSAWVIPLSLAGKSNFLWGMIHGDLLPKLMSGQQHHGMPPGYFMMIFGLMFWSAALFIWHGYQWAWQQRQTSIERFLLAWIIPTWIFFEIIPTKLPEYVLPTYPAIAILVAKALVDCQQLNWQKTFKILNKLQYIVWVVFGVILAVLVAYIPYYLTGKWSALSLFLVGIIGFSIFFVSLNIYYGKFTRAAILNIFASILVFFTIWQWQLPNLNALWMNEKIITAINKFTARGDNKTLLSIDYLEPSLVFLSERKVLFDNLEQAMAQLKQPTSVGLILVPINSASSILLFSRHNKLHLTLLTQINGFDFSSEHWLSLYLLKVN